MRTSKPIQPPMDVVADLNTKLLSIQTVLRKSAQGITQSELDMLYDTKDRLYDVLDILMWNISMRGAKI